MNYPLLSDFQDQKVTKAFGAFDETTRRAKRSYFIIGKEGFVRYKNVRPGNGKQDLLSTEELLKEIKKINQR